MSRLIRLLPKGLRQRYTDRLMRRATARLAEAHRLYALLDGISSGYEYTEGYRTHLIRRIVDLLLEHQGLEDRAATIAPRSV